MFNKLKKIYEILKDTPKHEYYFKNISNSVITIIKRSSFKIDDQWFENLLTIYYDDEIRCKYLPDLHEVNSFEREELSDILQFNSSKAHYVNQIRICHDYIKRFQDSYKQFYQYLKVESIDIVDSNNEYLKKVNKVFYELDGIKYLLDNLDKIFKSDGYEILQNTNKIKKIDHGIENAISFSKNHWNLILNKEPEEHILRYLFQHHNQVYYNLNELNMMVVNYKIRNNHKIIVGNAGTGKSHISAHLVEKINETNDFVIFLKSKSFNGDNVNFEERLLQLLQIPQGYTLTEILRSLNDFAKKNNKRCYITIDALNETTKSNIGFSDIWKINLQNFINQFSLYSNLYLVCTLRTSYVENIWDTKPNNLSYLKGFDSSQDLEKLCKTYFNHYKIEPTNFQTADLSYFQVPLLLDLFCKLTNESRSNSVDIELNIKSYLDIFESYIGRLIKEVRTKLNLQLTKPIVDGIGESSNKFLNVNEAQISPDEFTLSFDKELLIKADNSIARVVLEGYLIFIKDSVGKNEEIIKHTQQEIGGFLLAKKLVNDYPDTKLLVESAIFQSKIIGTDETQLHQLRLDILKFLIALKPNIVDYTDNLEVLDLSWWFLYNGFNPINLPDYDKKILSNANNDKILNQILNSSSKKWFDSEDSLNFNFVSNLLVKLDLWNYNLEWSYFIYQLGDEIFSFVHNTIEEIKDDKIEFSEATIKARFIAFILSTNIRELRDKATIFVIEFGKKYPLELLRLTVEFSSFKDLYVYERLVSGCYGVVLIKQNDVDFIEKILPQIAEKLFDLQFASKPAAPVYNYIVIDSIKHLLDLAILKGAIVFSQEDLERIKNYKFTPPFIWLKPSKKQVHLINSSHEISWPNPIGMDFGIYTIPRLVKREDDDYDRRNAITNVYKRIFELGYKELDLGGATEEKFKEFIWGHKIYGIDGKVDKLGKKYSWISFFDYAGYLLLNEKLNVYDKYGYGSSHYQRLSDVDIDISLPNTNYDINLKLYCEDLFDKKDSNLKWYEEIKIDSIKELFETKLEGDYSMLYGFIEQRTEEYKVRSFLMAETFFINKDENYEKIKKESAVFDWKSDVNFPKEHSRNKYFGELYWADAESIQEAYDINIPTEEKITYKRKREIYEILHDERLGYDNIDEEIEETSNVTFLFNSEATVIDYLWESDSEILKGFGEYFPSSKMGINLNLKADPNTGQILDNELNVAYKCISYEDNTHFKNTFNYMRSDLLRKYMNENNLALVYQVKQHSYDENLIHNRKLKFFIVD